MSTDDEEDKDDENRTNNQNNTSQSSRKNPGTGNYEDNSEAEDDEGTR